MDSKKDRKSRPASLIVEGRDSFETFEGTDDGERKHKHESKTEYDRLHYSIVNGNN